MQTNIFIPETIKVGFQERSSTYTGKLAYIIYFDEKGKLRKETSWNSWRDKEIPEEDYNNEPTSGFVLNKKAGGYSTGWNHRQTYVRVYDPRGFEFEISVPNLLYILENTSSIKGKGLEGEFVYGWDGADLLLMPVDAPDYKEISEYNKIRHANRKFLTKDMIPGATYLTKDNEHYIYLGKFHKYDWDGNKENGKAFFFYYGGNYSGIESMKSLNKIIDVVSEECVENYADLMDKLEGNSSYSPIDPEKDEYVPYTFEEFEERVKDRGWTQVYRHDKVGVSIGRSYRNNKYYASIPGTLPWNSEEREYETIKELFEAVKPMYKNRYLANGHFYGRDK